MAGPRAPGPDTVARIEWALGIISAAVVLAIAGYLVVEAVGGSATMPDLHVAIVPPEAEDGDAPAPGQVRFVVRNDGGRTATAVAVSLALHGADGAVVGDRRIVLDYLPGHSEATGGFVLPPGAAQARAEIAVEGYLDP